MENKRRKGKVCESTWNSYDSKSPPEICTCNAHDQNKYFKNCLIDTKKRKCSSFSNTVGKTSQHQQAAWWAFSNTQTRVVHCSTQITETCRPGIQQLAWQQGNRQTQRKKLCTEKEQFPSERAHLMNLFVTGGNVYQHKTLCSLYLL